MKHKKKLIALLCLMCAVGLPFLLAKLNRVSVDFEKHKWMIPRLASAKEVRFYEGLPHPEYEADLLKQEKKQNETVKVGRWHFYSTALEISEKEATRLKDLLAVESSYSSWSGHGKCGGFHPDCMVEFQVGESTFSVLICFGCVDAQIHGPSAAMKCSLDSESAARIVLMLKKHRKYRPLENRDPLSEIPISRNLLQEDL